MNHTKKKRAEKEFRDKQKEKNNIHIINYKQTKACGEMRNTRHKKETFWVHSKLGSRRNSTSLGDDERGTKRERW
jgi:hypothetical protein